MEQDYLQQEEHYLFDTLTNQPPQEDTKFFTPNDIDLDILIELAEKMTRKQIKINVEQLVKRLRSRK